MLRPLAVFLAALAFGCVETPVYSYPDPVPPPPPPPVVSDAPPPQQPAPTTTIVINGAAPAPQPVAAQPVCTAQFYGTHPVPEEYGGGWCTIEGPHCHDYLPTYTDQYQYRDNVYYFGVTVSSWAYYGPHPVPAEDGGGWCNIPGPHSHRYRPWTDFGWDPNRHVYIYHHGHWNNRPQPVPTSYPQPQPSYPSYPNRPAPQPSYPNRPQPSYPQPSYPQAQPSYPQPQYPGQPQAVHPTQPQPQPQRQPIPYGDDVHTHVVAQPQPAPPYRGPSDIPHAQPAPERPTAWGGTQVRPAGQNPTTPTVYHPAPTSPTVQPRPVSPGYGQPHQTNPNTVGAERPNPRPIPTMVRPNERIQRVGGVLPVQQNQRKRQEGKAKKSAPRPSR